MSRTVQLHRTPGIHLGLPHFLSTPFHRLHNWLSLWRPPTRSKVRYLSQANSIFSMSPAKCWQILFQQTVIPSTINMLIIPPQCWLIGLQLRNSLSVNVNHQRKSLIWNSFSSHSSSKQFHSIVIQIVRISFRRRRWRILIVENRESCVWSEIGFQPTLCCCNLTLALTPINGTFRHHHDYYLALFKLSIFFTCCVVLHHPKWWMVCASSVFHR